MESEAELKNVADYLLSTSRSCLKTAEGIMAEKRVKIFKGNFN